MSIDELCALPVETLAEKDCLLFLWATFPQLPEALRLIKAWGFTFKTVAFVWLKLNRKSPTWFYGLGYWTRGNAEICLLAKRGHPKRYSKSVHQFIISPVREHSRKPEEAREKIVALMGDLPRVELFARQSPPGWDVWGNEVESSPELRDTLSQSTSILQLFKQQRELRKGNAHTTHNVHDLAVFRLQLFLLQLLEPGLLFTDFGLDLINLGLNFHAFGSCHFKTSCHGKRP